MSKVASNTRKAVSNPRKAPVAPVQKPTPVLKPNKTSLNKLRKDQLVRELEVRGLDANGNKDVLVARLLRGLTDPEVAVNATVVLPNEIKVVPETIDNVAVIDIDNVAVIDKPDIAELEALKITNAQLESTLRAVHAKLADAQAKEEADRSQLLEVMAAVEQLKRSGVAEQEEAAALAQQLMQQLNEAQQESSELKAQQQQLSARVTEQLKEAHRESSELKAQQQQLSARVTELTSTVQAKDETIASLNSELQHMAQLAAQVQAVQFNGTELVLEVPAVQAAEVVGAPLAPAAVRRRVPSTSCSKAMLKNPACAGLMVCAAASYSWDAWRNMRRTLLPTNRIVVDAVGLMAAASSLLVLLQ